MTANIYDLFDKKVTPATTTTSTGEISAYAQSALDQEAGRVATAPEGTRNDTLNRAAFALGQLVAGGEIPDQVARDRLTIAAQRAGLGAREAEGTITSGLTAGAGEPRTAPVREAAPSVSTLDDGADDMAFWNSRPELSTIHQYSRARRVGPWAVLGGVLARVIASTSPSVVLPPLIGGYGSLNTFVAIVARSGGGKGTSQAAAYGVLEIHGGEPFPEISIGSGEGIVHAYVHREQMEKGQAPEVVQHNNSVLFSIPEVDTFAAIARRTGSTLAAEIRKVWSGEALGFQNADITRRLHVAAHAYRAALVLGVQPGRAAALLDDADGGTPQRFVWLPALDPDAPDELPELPEPIVWSVPEIPFRNGHRLIRVCDRAAEVIDRNRTATLRGDTDVLDGHSLFTRLKIGAALGLLDGRASVNEQDWHLAGQVMARSDATRAGIRHHITEQARTSNAAKARARAEGEIVAEQVIDNDRKVRLIKSIVRWLEKAPDGLTRSEIRRRAESRVREYVDQVLAQLVDEQVIAAVEITYQGQVGTRYRLITTR